MVRKRVTQVAETGATNSQRESRWINKLMDCIALATRDFLVLDFFEVDTSWPPRPPHIGSCWSVVSPRPPDCPPLFTTSFTVFEKVPGDTHTQPPSGLTPHD